MSKVYTATVGKMPLFVQGGRSLSVCLPYLSVMTNRNGWEDARLRPGGLTPALLRA